MLSLKSKKRKLIGKKVEKLRRKGLLPGVLYGPKVKNQPIETDLSNFKKVLKEAGESSLISLEVDSSTSSGQANKFSVLIHEVKQNPLTGEPIHVDFYQPILTEETEATVPLVFEGEPSAVKELEGTLIKEIQELTVRALPEKLPHEIKVNVESLKTFEDEILIKDLKLPEGVKIDRDPNEIVALVTPPEKVEEELEKPIEEEVEEVERVEEEKPASADSASVAGTTSAKEAASAGKEEREKEKGGGEEEEKETKEKSE